MVARMKGSMFAYNLIEIYCERGIAEVNAPCE